MLLVFGVYDVGMGVVIVVGGVVLVCVVVGVVIVDGGVVVVVGVDAMCDVVVVGGVAVVVAIRVVISMIAVDGDGVVVVTAADAYVVINVVIVNVGIIIDGGVWLRCCCARCCR